MKYRLAIFDFDGTLADSFPFFTSVFNRLAEQHGFKSIEPEMAPAFRHYGTRQIMERLEMPAWKLPVIGKSFIALMRQNAASIPLFEHVDEMLLALCCFLGCPLIMGGMMFMMRDREGSKLEREIRRLNAQADRRREATAAVVIDPVEGQPLARSAGEQAQHAL